MAFKLLAMAQQRWRKLNGAHLLPLVRAGVEFKVARAQMSSAPEGDRH